MLKINKEFKLPKNIFGQEPNLNLLAQAIHIYRERSHIGLRNTKTRAEVNRTGKKVYKQKGTGGARHGSRRANLFVGGGVTHGPRPLRRILDLTTAMKNAAKIQAFSIKAKEKEVFVVSGISNVSKTKEISEFLKKLTAKTFTFILSEKTLEKGKFLRNLANAKAVSYRNINAFDIFYGGTLILDQDIFK